MILRPLTIGLCALVAWSAEPSIAATPAAVVAPAPAPAAVVPATPAPATAATPALAAAPAPATVAVAAPVAAAAAAPQIPVDEAVQLFHPDIFATGLNRRPTHGMSDSFTTPASDIAREVSDNALFNLLVFLPFLILPQVLLIYVIVKFRDRGDGRKAATFVGNHTLEIVWTAIPVLALVAVSVPAWKLLWKMELPPPDQAKALVVEVRGKQYAWDYRYQREGIDIGQDGAGSQEPLVLEKDRVTVLNITSNDVNHAWWVPAFGVKKDAIIGRYTNTWFTPDTLGVFKGQCAELCGQGHGIMWISAVVVTPEQFSLWRDLQGRRNAALKVWNALKPGAAEAELGQALATALAKDASPAARWALRFWIAYHFEAAARRPASGTTAEQVRDQAKAARARLDAALARA
ncbi:MAG: cytochrome c oxidase subunit II [Planctomycetes bacterium]|nr:cytochrome c oxidase subunit II [Planctomycetota bacterium]